LASRRWAGQSQLREAADQRVDCDPPFQPGERRSQAEVDAAAEREVLVGAASQVQPVGVGKLSWVSIGRAQERENQLATVDLLATKLAGLRHDAPGQLHR